MLNAKFGANWLNCLEVSRFGEGEIFTGVGGHLLFDNMQLLVRSCNLQMGAKMKIMVSSGGNRGN